MHFDEWYHVYSIGCDLYIRALTRDGSSVVFFALINQSFQIDEYAWHIPFIYQVYSDYIPLLCVPSYNIEGWTLHPTTESSCTLHILIEAIYVFEWMKTRFFLEIILWRYSRYIPGISMGKVYIWYIPGIYQKKTFWGFQMCGLPVSLERRLGKAWALGRYSTAGLSGLLPRPPASAMPVFKFTVLAESDSESYTTRLYRSSSTSAKWAVHHDIYYQYAKYDSEPCQCTILHIDFGVCIFKLFCILMHIYAK